jgi:hypothetical protein
MKKSMSKLLLIALKMSNMLYKHISDQVHYIYKLRGIDHDKSSKY